LPLVLRVQRLWVVLPKLKGGGGWLEGEVAMGIERGLEEWVDEVGRGWGI
jgi:hypothetical protein